MEQINQQLQVLYNKIGNLDGQINLLSQQAIELSAKIKINETNKELFTQAIEILDLAQKVTRDTIKDGFESLVTTALQTVFGTGYSFELVYGRRGNLQEIDFVIKRPEFKESTSILDTSAGGEIDLVTLALRVIILELFQGNNKSPLILDEMFKHVSVEYTDKAGEFLKVLFTQMNRQIILVTHKSELAIMANNSIRIGETEEGSC